MNAKQLSDLQKMAEIDSSTVAGLIGVDPRTLSNWEKADKKYEIGKAYFLVLREYFGERILKLPLVNLVEAAFHECPSEYICVYVVSGEYLILFENTARHNLILGENLYLNDFIRKRKNSYGLTVQPLRTGRPIRKTKSQILQDSSKTEKMHTNANYLQTGVCQSILKIPYFVGSDVGPRAVLLLSLENKLRKNSKEPIKDEGDGAEIYNQHDEDIIYSVIEKEYKKTLEHLLNLLSF